MPATVFFPSPAPPVKKPCSATLASGQTMGMPGDGNIRSPTASN